LIQCGHCGHPLTGERYYNYYRCTYYNVPGHPRVRVTEGDLDPQVLAVFDKMRIEDEEVRDWFRTVLALQTRDPNIRRPFDVVAEGLVSKNSRGSRI
jgi:hypothetical protein